MMKRGLFILFLCLGLLSVVKTRGNHVSDELLNKDSFSKNYFVVSPQVEKDFIKKKESLHDSTIFSIFDTDSLTGDRLAAMKFLYAYMPLPDIASQSPEFFLKNVDYSLMARDYMPWGYSVPQREFMHFVLPLRVNNEPLDSSRWVFYEELKDRVSGLSMKEAILEVNHWCHEKVSYRPSDGRTSSPLSTLSQAIGRCGEESTFTVSALRAVGIPARQVYTPRWAHTDDNHAWVEAFADGQWYFFGACEPEPVLNLGWFNEPASRGILMNTNVIGKYDGPEEKLSYDEILTTINVTPNYTVTDSLKVLVTDPNGKPLKDARVSFCIFNYSEFYPVVTKTSDEAGKTSLIAGNGDMLIWATDGDNFGFNKGNSKNDSIVKVILDKRANFEGEFDMVIVPSPAKRNIPSVSEDLRALNNIRFAKEDSIRAEYISTFASEESANDLSEKLGLDSKKLFKILSESRGNHKNISDYLSSLRPEEREIAVDILLAVTEKDRRDIPISVLNDNVMNLFNYPDSTILNDYILNPRIEREPLVGYKSFFKDKFPVDSVNLFRSSPLLLVDWVKRNINEDNTWNPQGLKMDPISVWQQRIATESSANIFFVALCRSLGIPAMIDPISLNTRFMNTNGEWEDVVWETDRNDGNANSRIVIDYEPQGRITDPLYYTQFSLSKFRNGIPVQLEYDDEDRVSSINSKESLLDAGKYILTGSQRMADGSALTKSVIFNLPPDSVLHVNLILPQDSTKIQVIGNLDAENIYYDLASNQEKSILSTTGRGYYVVGLIKAGHEPSKHILNDLILASRELSQRPEKIILLFPSQEDVDAFDFKEFGNLPSNVVFGIDNDGKILAEISESLGIDNNTFPYVVIADTFNRIVYFNSGYTISTGERLLDILDKL